MFACTLGPEEWTVSYNNPAIIRKNHKSLNNKNET